MNTRGRTEFGRRLLAARLQSKLTQVQAAEAVGIKQGTLSELERSGQSSALLPQLAHLYGADPYWLATGEQPPQRRAADPSTNASQSTMVRGTHLGGLSSLKHATTIAPQQMTWEQLVSGDIPGPGRLFQLQLIDSALAPELPAGTDLIWSTDKPAAPGSIALVRDRHGQIHARQFRQGTTPGRWIAAATNPSFASFDSEVDGLAIMAVATFRAMP
jgi:transcriptional regulator with XRE-family HTH domain